jgi:hypothetical protein
VKFSRAQLRSAGTGARAAAGNFSLFDRVQVEAGFRSAADGWCDHSRANSSERAELLCNERDELHCLGDPRTTF